jgi:protein-S-isoprenylcysteine O-methyltransferase Ste14
VTPSPPDSPRRGQALVLPPALFLAALLLQILLHYVLPVVALIGWPWKLAGALFIVAGFGITVSADSQFKRANTPVHPFDTPRVLVTDGVFSFTRNPMYLGLLGVLVGVAIMLGTATPFLVPPLFAWVIAVRFIPPEEAALAAQFGAAYAEYKRRVRRWL